MLRSGALRGRALPVVLVFLTMFYWLWRVRGRLRGRLSSAAVGAILMFGVWSRTSFAQPAGPSASSTHVVIPFLANATKPTDLEFEGGECEVDTSGKAMACIFQQVFLTTSAVAPDTCLVTTNRYERAFRRETAARWVSTQGPEGVCGLLDVVTLQDGGGVRWTMEIHQTMTKPDASSTCQTSVARPETFSWQNIRRPLPCRFVQPGGLSR